MLNSHEIVQRQIKHYENIKLPFSVEVIFVDDGSIPAIMLPSDFKSNLTVYRTGDRRPWTEHIARNWGARIARGEYLLLIDIDYIVPTETIEACLSFKGDRMNFKRRFGILDENGLLRYDDDTLRAWNLKERWIQEWYFPGHRSQFLIRKDLFWKLGGYNEALDGTWRITGGAGEKFWRFWQRAERMGKVKLHPEQPTVFMFPGGKYCNDGIVNKFGMFHNLQRGDEMSVNKLKRRNSNKNKRRLARERLAKEGK